MYRAGRSFTEPVGLFCSSFAQSRTSGDGDSFGSPTSGVLPTESTRLSNRMEQERPIREEGRDRRGAGRREGQPPATAGRIVTVEFSPTGASRLPLKRTSSSS